MSLIAAPAANGLRRRLVTGLVWNLISAVASQGVTFGVNLIIARMLGREVFGEFSLLYSTSVALSILAAFAMGTAATRFIAQSAAVDAKRAGRVLGACDVFSLASGLTAAVVLALAAAPVSAGVLESPHLSRALLIVSISVFFSASNSFLAGALAGLECFRPLALVNLSCGALYLGGSLVASWIGGLEGALAAMAFYHLLLASALRIILRRQARNRGISFLYRQGLSELGPILGFAAPAALATVSTLPTQWMGQAILVRQEDGFNQNALFAAANTLRMFVVFLPFVVTNFKWTILNQQVGVGDSRRFRKVFWLNALLNVVLALAGSGAMLLAGEFLLGLFGKSFVEGDIVLLILLASALPEAVGIAFSLPAQCKGRIWLYLSLMVAPRDIIRVLLAWLLCPLYGAVGLAVAFAIGWGYSFAASLIVLAIVGLKVDKEPGTRIEQDPHALTEI